MHDRALLQVAALSLEPTPQNLQAAIDGLEELADSRALIARYRLRAVGASPVTVSSSEDAAARCFDDMSIAFHELKCREAAVKSVERALELERAEHVRERLLRNKRVMS